MAARLVLRTANPADLEWANARYAEADFLPSDPSHTVMIAELDGVRAGLGRLVPAGPGVFELGGMYVLPVHRGRGIAPALIAALLEAAGGARVYCIPYAHLSPLYARAGFRPVDGDAVLPPPVAAKLDWCRQHYAQPVCLMWNGAPAGE